jgi:hypothetical protein
VTKGGTQPYNYNKRETYNNTEAFTYWNMECNLKVKILTYARQYHYATPSKDVKQGFILPSSLFCFSKKSDKTLKKL